MPRLQRANQAISTLAVDITTTGQDSFSVVDSSSFPDEGPFVILINEEYMEVGTIDKGTHTLSAVLRGQEGSTATTHTAGDPVRHVFSAKSHGELVDTTDSRLASVIPSGGIIMWSGAEVDIPTGWLLCNGANGTPDLRDRFVVGAGSSYAVGATGGADGVTLATTEIPSHTHTNPSTSSTGSHTHSNPSTGSGGSHSHNSISNHTHGSGSYSTSSDGSHSHNIRHGYFDEGTGDLKWDINPMTSNMASTENAGAHSHSVSGSSSSAGGHSHTSTGTAHTHTVADTGSSGSHSHSIGDTGTTGGGESHENRPPFYALCFIMKE